jgi:hypothetical protein
MKKTSKKPPKTNPMTATHLVLLIALLGACGTKYVDLTLPAGPGTDGGGVAGKPADAGPQNPIVRCEPVKRSDGSECKICYAADGTVTSGACTPVPAVMPPAVGVIDPATATCKVSPQADGSRCLACYAPPGEYTVCLKCEPPVQTGAAGETCRACLWSDQGSKCLQCFDGKGTVTHDDCDSFRKEKFPAVVVPPSK